MLPSPAFSVTPAIERDRDRESRPASRIKRRRRRVPVHPEAQDFLSRQSSVRASQIRAGRSSPPQGLPGWNDRDMTLRTFSLT
mmetsp:Transcript_30388/g.63487  ORF Transcript_30388/g.63487 Transcript_30388/m.63487 type:complete len:83 (+) Transcript_30388:93-341(+)